MSRLIGDVVRDCRLYSVEVPDDTTEFLPVRRPWHHRVKKWAYQNAYTLIFLAVMFGVTWVLLVLNLSLNLGLDPSG